MATKKNNILGISNSSAKIIAAADAKEDLITSQSLKDKRIAISVSNSEEYEELGFSKYHQKDITLELTRYLLVNGAYLVYGGDLREDGYTHFFSELSFQYRNKEEHNNIHYTNYFGWPIYNLLKNSDEAQYKKNRVEIKKCKVPKEVPESMKGQFVIADSIKNRFFWALSMTQMREEMIKGTSARILIGGALSNYKGFYPGILEEGYLSLKANQPLFLIGAFGGATGMMIRAVRGENEKKLADEVFDKFPSVKELYKYTGDKEINKKMQAMFAYFKKIGVGGLSALNGLTNEQNELLFDTIHFHEMIYYVLIGLKRKL